MDWYKHYMGDYMRDTAHLRALQHGIYRLLMDHYYATEKPLSLNHDELYMVVRAIKKDEQEAVDYILDYYFDKRDGGYHSNRIDKEINKYRERSAINKRNASESHSKSVSETVATPETRNQKPETRVHNPKPKSQKHTDLFVLPEWIDPVLWDEWMAIRKKLKAVNSKRAMDGLVDKLFQVSQSGISVNTAIKTAIERSWKSVEVDWLKPKNGNANIDLKNEKSVVARGKQLGIYAKPGESMFDYNRRLLEAQRGI